MNPAAQLFPHTLEAVCAQLEIDGDRLMALCNEYHIAPHRDEASGTIFFGVQDVEALSRLVKAGQSGQQLPASSNGNGAVLAAASGASVRTASGQSVMPQKDLSVIVDAVSNAKDIIMRDISMLLDDKLSGLDDIVVELIRSKTEIERLQAEVARLNADRSQLERELGKFKPTAFGFYSKEK